MRKFFLRILMILLFLPLNFLPGEVLSLNRESSISMALANNSDLLNASLSLKTAQRAKNSSWNLFLPEVSASLGLTESKSISGQTSSNILSLNPGLSLSYTFVPGIKESLRQLKLKLKESGISYEDVRRQLIMNVEIEFYYLITSRSNLKIQEKNIELAKKRYTQIKVKFQNGTASELEMLQEKVNAANLIPTYSSLQSAFRNRLKEFLVVLGIDPLKEVELIGTLEVEDRELDIDILTDHYIDNRTDIRFQRNQVEILESSLIQARNTRHLPSVSLSASWSEKVQDPFLTSTWENYSTNNTTSFSLGVVLGLDDFIPGSSTDLGVKEIDDSVAKARLTLGSLIQKARLEIINLMDSLETDRKNLELSGLNLELSETSYKMTAESFSKGKSDRLTLDDAQQSLLTSRQNLLESQYQYIRNLITLRGALGLDSLEELE